MTRTSLDSARESLRLQQIYNVFLRYGWDLLFQRWQLLDEFRRGMQRWVWQLPPDLPEATTPVKVRLMIEELGPTYVKTGQIVSSQASVIPTEWQVELDKLQSNVPPFPSRDVRAIIIEELGAPPERLYATFNPQPFAAASTAQVHRATLHNGTDVVVKVQRPEIRTQMKADLGIMMNAARVVSRRFEYVQTVDLVGMLQQFSSNVLAELDYTGEAYNAYRLKQNMEGIEGVKIPNIYLELSSSKVLTMDYISGVKINNIEAIDAAGLDRQELARTALRALVKQLMIDGFFHADPHPGNILVNLEDSSINFLDLGMVGELDLNQRMNIAQLLFAVQGQDVTGMAQVLRSLSEPFMGEVDDKAYYKDFERKIGRFMYSGNTASFGQSVNVAFDLLREHGLRLDPNLTLAIKALMQTEAVSTRLFPEGGLAVEGAAMVKEMAIEEVTADKILEVTQKQVIMSAREVLKRVPSLTDATTKWLQQYEKGRFEVYVDTSDLAKEVDKMSRFGRMIVIAIMLVGMIIGSAIATTVIALTGPQGEVWDFILRLAYLGYVFAMIVAIIILLRLVWRWLRGKDANFD